jgi:hypothetical protein
MSPTYIGDMYSYKRNRDGHRSLFPALKISHGRLETKAETRVNTGNIQAYKEFFLKLSNRTRIQAAHVLKNLFKANQRKLSKIFVHSDNLNVCLI